MGSARTPDKQYVVVMEIGISGLKFSKLILMQMQKLYVLSMSYKIKIVVWYSYNTYLVELQ